MSSTAEDTKSNDLRQMTIGGIGWTAGAQVIKQVLQFSISVALARLLTPEDFGLIGMIVVFTGFAAVFGELGFGAALIQREEVEEKHYSSIFWLNLVAGLILMIGMIALAPAVASFYGEPRLYSLTMAIAANFSLRSLNIVQYTILRRAMRFRLLAYVEVISMLTAGSLAITLALMGYGVWSLVGQTLVVSGATALILWCVTGWYPHLLFDRIAVKDLWSFSVNLLGFKAFNYWLRQGDDLLVGRHLGKAVLGVYTRAYSLMLLPLSQITGVLSQVMFPALSRIQQDKQHVKQIYLRSVAVIALICFPVMIGLFVTAEHFVLALYGSQWSSVTPLLRIFCSLGVPQSIAVTVGWIYTSQGRTDWMFRWTLASGVCILGSFGLGIWLGTAEAVAASYALVYGVLLLYPGFRIPGKLIGMTFSEIVRCVRGILGCALGMGGMVWGLGLALPSGWPHWVQLVIQVPFGMVAYWALIHVFRVRSYIDAKTILVEQWYLRRTPPTGAEA